MAYLVDTNIFLRAAKRNDPERQLCLEALQQLAAQAEECTAFFAENLLLKHCDNLIEKTVRGPKMAQTRRRQIFRSLLLKMRTQWHCMSWSALNPKMPFTDDRSMSDFRPKADWRLFERLECSPPLVQRRGLCSLLTQTWPLEYLAQMTESKLNFAIWFPTKFGPEADNQLSGWDLR